MNIEKKAGLYEPVNPNYIPTCIFRCKKGIYYNDKMEPENGGRYCE